MYGFGKEKQAKAAQDDPLDSHLPTGADQAAAAPENVTPMSPEHAALLKLGAAQYDGHGGCVATNTLGTPLQVTPVNLRSSSNCSLSRMPCEFS